MQYDAIIIGGGIVGAACALEAAREKLRVCVVEADIIGGGATAAGMGHIVVMDDSEAQFALTNYSQKLWRAVAKELPHEVEYNECGTIWVAVNEQELEEVRRKHQYYNSRGVAAEILDSKALENAEPNLRKGLPGGLLIPQDSVIYPPCAAHYFIDQAQDHGAELIVGKGVTEILDDGVRLTDGSVVQGEAIVNACGSWSPALAPGIDVQKRKGHLVITDRFPGFAHHQLVELGYLKSAHSLTSDSVAFNVQPRVTGQLLIGSSRQYGVDDKKIDSTILRRMLERAYEYMPRLRELSAIRTWTGFRAATPDKLPLIGPCHRKKNLYLATGHEGLGITTSLATARILVDQLLNRKSEIPIEPYLPARIGKVVDAVAG